MIEVRGLKKTFDGFAALDGADLSVPRGAVYGLVGPNGAGKTTLLRHLTGVYRQDEGSVRFDGEEIWENAGVKARIASIPDDWFYFMQAGLRDMMRFYRGLYPKFDQERFEKLREVFALDEKRPLRRMSKGQQKQAAFWLALCTMPDYLILDEPVDGLDSVMRRQVWSLILQDVAERGTTVLVSSHNLRELEDVCDHVGVMSRGKLLLEHSLSELQDYTVKLQLAFEGAELPALPQEIKVLHHAQTGRVHTLICRGSAEELEQQLAALHPIFIDAVPLSLEEIFIYELGGEDYAIRDIVLSRHRSLIRLYSAASSNTPGRSGSATPPCGFSSCRSCSFQSFPPIRAVTAQRMHPTCCSIPACAAASSFPSSSAFSLRCSPSRT